MLFFSIIERSVLMALVFYYKDMLEKVTMPRTQQFSAFVCYRKNPISFPELRSPWPVVGKRELWEQPLWKNKGNNRILVIRLTAHLHLWRMPEMVAPRARVFRPLVKGNEALGTRLERTENPVKCNACAVARKIETDCFSRNVPISNDPVVRILRNLAKI